MVISHHPPSQNDRTIIIFRQRVCCRCFFIVLGTISILIIFKQFQHISLNYFLIIGIFSPLPACVNFILTEISKSRNSNLKRSLTGYILGFSTGTMLHLFLQGLFFTSICIFIYFIVMEFFIVSLLIKFNVLERFITEYEKGIIKE